MFKAPIQNNLRDSAVARLLAGEDPTSILSELDIHPSTLRRWVARDRGKDTKSQSDTHDVPHTIEIKRGARLLFIDIETLPNMGLFFDTYSDRAIPLQFIMKPKCICTIAWKFSDEKEPTAICAATPYEDKHILEQILPIFEQADYVVWHFGEGFDRKFLDGRLFANGLPALPPVASIDTYKLARNKFGRTLNSNKLDHLGELLGVGRKNKTDASLWTRCASGDLEAMQEMALYNVQDIILLEAVYNKLAPSVTSKLNHNLMHDDAVTRCKSCGSSDIVLKGFELTASTLRHRYQCTPCKAWSTYPRKK